MFYGYCFKKVFRRHLLEIKSGSLFEPSCLKYLVGMRGFEPPTPSSRTKCATGLRYIPNKARIIGKSDGIDKLEIDCGVCLRNTASEPDSKICVKSK